MIAAKSLGTLCMDQMNCWWNHLRMEVQSNIPSMLGMVMVAAIAALMMTWQYIIGHTWCIYMNIDIIDIIDMRMIILIPESSWLWQLRLLPKQRHRLQQLHGRQHVKLLLVQVRINLQASGSRLCSPILESIRMCLAVILTYLKINFEFVIHLS